MFYILSKKKKISNKGPVLHPPDSRPAPDWQSSFILNIKKSPLRLYRGWIAAGFASRREDLGCENALLHILYFKESCYKKVPEFIIKCHLYKDLYVRACLDIMLGFPANYGFLFACMFAN